MDELVYLKNDEPVCSSLQVAEKFGKRHADVMRSIDNLIKNDSTQNCVQCFKQSAYKDDTVDVVLTDGTTEHFTLEDHDQTSLVGLQSQVAAGEENIPWHTSNEAEHCKFYSNKDMKKITATTMAYVTWHVTYFRDLRIYIRSLESKEDVEKVTYGMDIPEAYQSEPLKAMLAQKS